MVRRTTTLLLAALALPGCMGGDEEKDEPPAGTIASGIRVGPQASMAAGDGRIFVRSADERSVMPVSPRTGKAAGRPIEVGAVDGPIAAGGGRVFMGNSSGTVAVFDSARSRVLRRTRIGAPPRAIVYAGARTWVLTEDALLRLDSENGRVTGSVPGGGGGTGMALEGNTLWVADGTKARALDARTGRPNGEPDAALPENTTAIAAGAFGLYGWSATELVRTGSKDTYEGEVTDVTTGAGGVWVAEPQELVLLSASLEPRLGPVKAAASEVLAAYGSLWALSDGKLLQVKPAGA